MNCRHLLGIVSALALTVMYGCGKEAPPPAPKAEAPTAITVKIGSASPLTGPQAHIGVDIKNGVQSKRHAITVGSVNPRLRLSEWWK